MENRLPPMPRKIDLESMRLFLRQLKDNGLLYHIDDDPLDIGFWDYKGDWIPTFTDSEAYALIGFFSMATGQNGKGPLSWNEIWDVFPPID